MTRTAPPFACQGCGTRYRLRDESKLRDRARSTCPKCGTRFVFFLTPVTASGGSPFRVEVASPDDTVKLTELTADRLAPGAIEEGARTRGLAFRGQGGSLFGIHLVNVFFTLLTLGIYRFWAKVRVRNFLWSQTEFEGDRFAYHGTGRELFNGAMKAGVIFGLPYVVVSNIAEVLSLGMVGHLVGGLLAVTMIVVFLAVAMVSVRRYRHSRTSWRGVRFSFRGRTREFLKLYVPSLFLIAITLGFYYPYYLVRKQAFMTSHSYFGNRAFRFDGKGKELARLFLVPYLLTPVTLGLSWIWISARQHRYFWDHTMFDKARFHSMVWGWDLFKLQLANFFFLVLTLGFAWPWVAVRNATFYLHRLTLEGPLDVDQVFQDAQTASSTGEGLSDFLDAEFDLG